MPARPSCGVVLIASLIACSAGNNRVDPEDLALRDLLGVSPDTAMAWDGAQRAAARRGLDVGLRAHPAPSARGLPDASLGLDERIAQLLAANDLERDSDGSGALGVVRVAIDARAVADLTPRPAPLAAHAIASIAPQPVTPAITTQSTAASAAPTTAGVSGSTAART